MTVREILLPWDQQPQERARLRVGRPGSWLWMPGQLCLAGGDGIAADQIGATSVQPSLAGLGMAVGGANSAVLVPPQPTLQMGQIAYVVQLVFTSTSSFFAGGFGYSGSGAGGFYVEQPFDFNLDQNGSASVGKLRCSFRTYTGGATRFGPASACFSTGVLHTAVVLLNAAASAELWVDGRSIPLTFSDSGFVDAPTTIYPKRFAVGNFNYGSNPDYVAWGTTGATYSLFARIVGRDFDPREVSINPYSLLEPQRIIVPYSAAAPSAVPNITFVGAENITATSADYRVTLDYA